MSVFPELYQRHFSSKGNKMNYIEIYHADVSVSTPYEDTSEFKSCAVIDVLPNSPLGSQRLAATEKVQQNASEVFILDTYTEQLCEVNVTLTSCERYSVAAGVRTLTSSLDLYE